MLITIVQHKTEAHESILNKLWTRKELP